LASAGFRLAAADYALARLGWQVEYREFTDVRPAKMALPRYRKLDAMGLRHFIFIVGLNLTIPVYCVVLYIQGIRSVRAFNIWNLDAGPQYHC
jgi:hypothetical protein